MAGFALTFLFVACVSLAAWLETWFVNWQGNRASSSNVLAVVMGDSRRMFANHFFVKADVYFHRGYYPTIFDDRAAFETSHVAADSGAMAEHNDEDSHNFLGKPRDCIERFNRYFMPNVHTELADQGGGIEREILPWLKLSAELDPQRVETYTTASFWLSERLGKLDEAKIFLRQGLHENPNSFEILFELGRLSYVHDHDSARARNLWEKGLREWRQQEGMKAKPDTFFLEKFTAHLARLEEREGHLAAAVKYLEMLRPVAPHPQVIQKQIEDLKVQIERSPERSASVAGAELRVPTR